MFIIWNFGRSDEATTVKIDLNENLMRKVIEILFKTLCHIHSFLWTRLTFEDGTLIVGPSTTFPLALISPDCLHLGLVKAVLMPVGDRVGGLCNGLEFLLLRSFIVRIPHYILNVQNKVLPLISPKHSIKSLYFLAILPPLILYKTDASYDYNHNNLTSPCKATICWPCLSPACTRIPPFLPASKSTLDGSRSNFQIRLPQDHTSPHAFKQETSIFMEGSVQKQVFWRIFIPVTYMTCQPHGRPSLLRTRNPSRQGHLGITLLTAIFRTSSWSVGRGT